MGRFLTLTLQMLIFCMGNFLADTGWGRGKIVDWPSAFELSVSYRHNFLICLYYFQSLLIHTVVGLGRAPGFFDVDPLSGEVKITNDLKKGSDLEYTVSFIYTELP